MVATTVGFKHNLHTKKLSLFCHSLGQRSKLNIYQYILIYIKNTFFIVVQFLLKIILRSHYETFYNRSQTDSHVNIFYYFLESMLFSL